MSVIWKDGHFVDGTVPQIYHDDGGFANALGVFDAMLVQNGVLIDARAHFDRLVNDAGIVLDISPSWMPAFEQMTEAWLPLLSRNNLHKGFARMKTIVTGGVSDKILGVSEVPSIVVSVAPCPAPESLGPITCAIVTDPPRVAGSRIETCKRLDYTRALMARRTAVAMGADEAIITNTRGHIACGATSNLFIEEHGMLITPPLSDGVLAGITRANILRDRNSREDYIGEERLRAADKVFLTNSFFGLRPVNLLGR